MSDKDDIARRRKAERERLKNEQRAAAEGAAAEEAAGRRLDSQFDKDIRDLLGGVAPGELDALRKVSSGDDRISIERAQRAIRRGSTPHQRRTASTSQAGGQGRTTRRQACQEEKGLLAVGRGDPGRRRRCAGRRRVDRVRAGLPLGGRMTDMTNTKEIVL